MNAVRLLPKALLPAALALLVALDLLRATQGPALRPWQWAAGALALLALWRVLSERGLSSGEALPLLALAALLVPTYVDHARTVSSDGVHYYSYLRSLLFDRDLDLADDYALLGARPQVNVLPVGAALLWSPAVGFWFLVTQAARLLGAPAPDGVEPTYQALVCLATFAYGAAGLFLLYGVLRRRGGAAAAFWTTVLCWVGSPLRFYLSVLPSLAHGVEFFAAVLALRASLALRARADRRRGLWAGAACGLAFLTRSQDGLLLVVPALFLLPGLLRRDSFAATLRSGASLAVGFAIAAAPQVAVWQAMFGVPLLIPHKVIHGAQFLHADHPELFGMLFSPRGGLFVTYPALLAAFLGLIVLARRDGSYAAAVLPLFAAGWYLNASVFDWYQVRRFTGLVPFLAPGLARVVGPLARAGPIALAALTFLTLRYDLAVDALRDRPGAPAPVRNVAAELTDALAADAYALFERQAPRAAVALLGAYTGQTLLEEGVSYLELGRPTWLLRLPRRAHFVSEVETEEGELCRWVEGAPQATFFLPLDVAGGVVVTIRAHPLELSEPLHLEALWNDAPLGRQAIAEGWRDYRFHVPQELVQAGTNVLALRFDRAPIFRRARGAGPRRIRPAAIASLTLHPEARP